MALKPGGRVAAVLAGTMAATVLWLGATTLGLDDILGLNAVRWVGAAAAVGAVAGGMGLGRYLTGPAASTLALVLAVSWVPWFGALAHRLVRSDSLPTGPVDAVIVLAAAVSTDERITPAGADRLLEGLRLVKAGAAPRLVVSRVWAAGTLERSVSSDRDQRELVALVEPTVEIHLLDSVGTTRVEAVRAKALFDQHRWRSAIVVTSPVHTRRACAAFEAVGLAVSCRASPDRTAAIKTQQTPLDRTSAFSQWLYETLGWWDYRVRGWIHTDRESGIGNRQ
jgi:uncharacterized SAM-binding protein YcdF (DUF218 family)